MDQQNVPTSPPQVPSSGIPKIFLIIFAFAVLAGITVGAYVLGTKKEQATTVPTPTPLPSEVLTKEGDPTANWKIYTSSEDGYSIKYPINTQPALQQDSRVYQGIGGSVNIDEWALLGQPSYGVMIVSYKEGVNPKLEFNLEPAPESTVTIESQQVKRLDSKDGTLTHIGPIKNKDLNYILIYTGNKSKLGLDVFEGMISTFKFL